MSCGIEKKLGSPYKPLYVGGLNLKKKKRILGDTNFLQDKLFKQGSSLFK